MFRGIAQRVVLLVGLALWSCAQAAGGTVLVNQSYRSPLFGPYTRDGGALFYAIYLPQGYDEGTRRYPVIYLLHGLGGSAPDWLNYGHIKAQADHLISQKTLPPSIIVLPHLTNILTLRPEKRPESLEQLLSHDLLRHIDTTYRTEATATGRTIAGASLNGYTALYLALKHPNIYSAGASLSGPFWGPEVAASKVGDPMLSWFFGNLARAASYNVFDLITNRSPLRTRVLLTCGDDDAFLKSTVQAYLALQEAGVASELRITDGTHGWATWRAAVGDVLVLLGTANTP